MKLILYYLVIKHNLNSFRILSKEKNYFLNVTILIIHLNMNMVNYKQTIFFKYKSAEIKGDY